MITINIFNSLRDRRGFAVGALGLTIALFAGVFASGCSQEVEAPTADIELLNQGQINAGVEVTLDGSGSKDGANGTGMNLEFRWRFVSVPAGSQVALNGDDLEAVTFVPDEYGVYMVGLVVDNGLLKSKEDTLEITVGACGIEPPAVGSVTITPALPNTGDLVSVAIEVSDADNAQGCDLGQVLSVASQFEQRPSGSTAVMAPSEGLSPAFTADVPGNYIIRTTVVDSTGLSSFVDTTVPVETCGSQAPSALLEVVGPVTAGPGSVVVSPVVGTGLVVALDGSTSADPDAEPPCSQEVFLSYAWTFLAKPPSSDATFNDASLQNPSFVADVPGQYEIQLVVSDGDHTDHAYLLVEADSTLYLSTASGFEIEFVAGGTWWNDPEGIAVDSSGAIYVAQNGTDVVTRTDDVATVYFSAGGYMNNIHDIAHLDADDSLFVTSEDWDAVVQLSVGGGQTLWCDSGDVNGPKGIDIFQDSSGNPRMVVAERDNDSIAIFDATDAAPANRIGTENFTDNLDRPWGVTGRASGGTNYYYASNDNSDDLWSTDTNFDYRYVDNMNGPRDVVVSPSGDLIVADSQSGIVYTVEDCGGANCNTTLLAWGIWGPWGLAFESDTQLLVTDRNGDSLFRITGPF